MNKKCSRQAITPIRPGDPGPAAVLQCHSERSPFRAAKNLSIASPSVIPNTARAVAASGHVNNVASRCEACLPQAGICSCFCGVRRYASRIPVASVRKRNSTAALASAPRPIYSAKGGAPSRPLPNDPPKPPGWFFHSRYHFNH